LTSSAIDARPPINSYIISSRLAVRVSGGDRLADKPLLTESAFERMEQGRIEGVAIDDEGMFNANIGAIAALAAKRRLISIGNKELAQAGGLIGYGVNYFATFRRAAAFVDKILKGTNPADLPIEQATKFEFVLNLKAARALGLDVPTSMPLRADEVIE
jgi:putative tryptophan/tyrosine transport system substrate-binding protein